MVAIGRTVNQTGGRRPRLGDRTGISTAVSQLTVSDGVGPTRHRGRLATLTRSELPGPTERSCTSSSWGAAGSAASWPACSRSTATPSPSSTSAARRSGGSRRASAATGRRVRLRPRHPDRGGHRPRPGRFAAVTSGDNSNIMSARVARETFEIERVVARIYDPRRAGSTSGSASRRSPPSRGPPTRSSAGSSPTSARADWVDPTSQVVPASSATSRPGGPAASSRSSTSPDASRSSRSPAWAAPGSSTGELVGQEGDILHFIVDVDDLARPRRAARPTTVRQRRAPLMRVAIAGAGNVGVFIANELVEQRPRRAPHRAAAGGRRAGAARRRASRSIVADACEVSSLKEAGLETLRRRRRRDRRRRGQPRRLAARQAGVRRPARHRPGQPPEERVAVQRDVGRRHLGVDPAPHHRARRRGRERRPARPAVPARGRPGRRSSR